MGISRQKATIKTPFFDLVSFEFWDLALSFIRQLQHLVLAFGTSCCCAKEILTNSYTLSHSLFTLFSDLLLSFCVLLGAGYLWLSVDF